jgi:hypothetical protein
MVTREQALTSREFHFGTCVCNVGPKGGKAFHQMRYRRNGATRTWKTRPNEYRLPVKHGLKTYGTISEATAHLWHAAEDCPLANED